MNRACRCAACDADAPPGTAGYVGHPLPPVKDVGDFQVRGVKGRKLARFDLLPPDALWEVSEVLGWGASNRGDTERNWELGIVGGDGLASAQRHIAQWMAGEETDEDTGKSHLAHAICNLMFLLALQMRGQLVDTRGPHLGSLRTETLAYSGRVDVT